MPADLLLLWNDVEDGRRLEYECWHALEHVPERTWVPGFRCGTRYERVEGAGARYLTAYELDALDCLESSAYRLLVDRPTPWSASMRPSLRQFLRRTYAGRAEVGSSLARFVWVRRVVLDAEAGESSLDRAILDHMVAACAAEGARYGACRLQAGLQQASGPQAVANVDDAPQGIELVFVMHHVADANLLALNSVFDSVASGAIPQAAWTSDAVYRMLSTVRHEDVRSRSRPPPREDLRQQPW